MQSTTRYSRSFLVPLLIVVGGGVLAWAGNTELVEKKVDELQTLNRQVLDAAVDKAGLKEGDVITVKAQILPTRDVLGAVKAESVQILDLKVNGEPVAPAAAAEKPILPEDRLRGNVDGGIKSENIKIPDGVK